MRRCYNLFNANVNKMSNVPVNQTNRLRPSRRRQCEMVQAYGRRQLLALRTSPGSKSTSYVGHLAVLDLLRYRGSRAGASTQRRRSRVSVYQHDPHNQLGRVPNVYHRSYYRVDVMTW